MPFPFPKIGKNLLKIRDTLSKNQLLSNKQFSNNFIFSGDLNLDRDGSRWSKIPFPKIRKNLLKIRDKLSKNQLLSNKQFSIKILSSLI